MRWLTPAVAAERQSNWIFRLDYAANSGTELFFLLAQVQATGSRSHTRHGDEHWYLWTRARITSRILASKCSKQWDSSELC